MKNSYFVFSLLAIMLVACKNNVTAQSASNIDYNELSEKFLAQALNGEDTKEIRGVFANSTLKDLELALDNDQKKLAFWVNVYNAYILDILKDNPKLYEDRGSFFKNEQIPIAGDTISFAKIEHGIIRKSQWEYGLGRIRKWFPNKLERKLRVDKRDYRIHFALNCGAKDCPPVAIYEWERLDEQFDKGTEKYLSGSTIYDASKKEVAVTSLFSWFRGDFGGKSGVKKILKNLNLIPTTKDIDITYKNYDWTLDLDNYIEL